MRTSIQNSRISNVSDKNKFKGERVILALSFFVGTLMPIDVIGSISPGILDVLRYSSALILILILHTKDGPIVPTRPLLGIAALLLISVGILSILKAFLSDGNFIPAAAALVSPIVAYLLAKFQNLHRMLLLGLVFGCFLSSLDIILQVLGMPFLGTPSTDGFRYSGFSLKSTHVAPLLAVAICIVLSNWAWRTRQVLLRLLLLGTLFTALLLSQGRVGLAGLIVAVGILIAISVPKRPVIMIFGILVGMVCLLASDVLALFFDYVLRADTPTNSGFSSGRGELNSLAWEAFLHGGVIGLDGNERNLFNPHIAPLSSGLNIGPYGLVAISIICILLAFLVFFGGNRVPAPFRMIAGIAVTIAMIEPTGFFVGFSGSLLLMLCFAQYSHRTNSNVSTPGKQTQGM
ncbi:hypothetical protein [Corynebacterium glutamicum]|uniref:hypothetical protein n=1 Tax=Corynebacterium glutamicum TaxID=1718 RepID=UPI001B8C4C0D|nr:hypothetical protein [Corynebacterium glutamicum]